MKNVKESANFIWSIADLLRGDYKQSDYGKVILPLTVLRRLDCVLEKSKADVLKKFEQLKTTNIENLDPILNKTAGYNFHNRSQFDFNKLIADPNNIASNLRNYINGFSEDAREIIEQFEFENQINKINRNKRECGGMIPIKGPRCSDAHKYIGSIVVHYVGPLL